jgi:drug/metabolite transporter (DMT)-like permease
VRWGEAVLRALLGGLGFALLAYTGFSRVPAAHGSAVLHGTLPLTTCAVLRATTRRAVPRARMAGFALIGIGVALIAVNGWMGAPLREVVGDGLLLLASVSWSAYGVMARRMGLPAAQTAAIVAVFSMCWFLPVYAILPGSTLFRVSVQVVLVQAVVQGVLLGAVAIFVYTRAIAALGPARTAMFTAAVPCVTTLAAMPLLAEFPNGAEWAGIAVLTLGMIVAARSPNI